jgi:hypothetical protein
LGAAHEVGDICHGRGFGGIVHSWEPPQT